LKDEINDKRKGKSGLKTPVPNEFSHKQGRSLVWHSVSDSILRSRANRSESPATAPSCRTCYLQAVQRIWQAESV